MQLKKIIQSREWYKKMKWCNWKDNLTKRMIRKINKQKNEDQI